MLQQTTETTS